MEEPLTTFQFVQIAALIGLPVHLGSIIVAAIVARRRFVFTWVWILLLVPAWLAVAIFLQAVAWKALPDMPEHYFMIFGFINTPALVGNIALVAALAIFSRLSSRRLAA